MGIEEELTSELRGTVEAAKAREYNATYFLRMLDEHGGVEAAKRLLAVSKPQTGLFELYHLELLDISMEATILKDKYKGLFTEDELAEAHKRLDELDYFK